MPQYIFQVQRFLPEVDNKPYEKQYEVDLQPDASVLEGLHYIRLHHDSSLAYRYACRSSVCGSCAIRINGVARLACRTKVNELKTPNVVVKPLPFMTPIKDLVVDLKPFWDAYRKIMPWLIKDENKQAKDVLVTEEKSRDIEKYITCILCAACYTSCLVTRRERCYVGPQALQEACRFVKDPRDDGTDIRLKNLDSDGALWGCDTLFRCVDVCPWDIKPAESVLLLRRMAAKNRIKRMFG